MSSAWRSVSLNACDQRRLRLVRFADDPDHLVDVEQHQLPAFEDVDAVVDLPQPELRAARAPSRSGTRSTPAGSRASAFWRGRPSRPIITRLIEHARLEAGMRQQHVHELLSGPVLRVFGSNTSRTGASRPDSSRIVSSTPSSWSASAAAAPADSDFLPSLTFGLVSSSISSSTFCDETPVRQLGDDQLPLAARQVLDLPARAHLHRAAAGAVDVGDVRRRRDDLAAARESPGPGMMLHQFVDA